jgi:hypothetical protein
VNILGLQHNIPRQEPAGGCHVPIDRDILGVSLHCRFYRIVPDPDPEILPIRGKAIDQIRRILNGLALRKLSDRPAFGIFIGTEEFQSLLLEKRVDHKSIDIFAEAGIVTTRKRAIIVLIGEYGPLRHIWVFHHIEIMGAGPVTPEQGIAVGTMIAVDRARQPEPEIRTDLPVKSRKNCTS